MSSDHFNTTTPSWMTCHSISSVSEHYLDSLNPIFTKPTLILPSISAEGTAKFSSSQLRLKLPEFESSNVFGNLKLSRVSNKPSPSNCSKTQVEIRGKNASNFIPMKRKSVSNTNSLQMVVDDKDNQHVKRCKIGSNKDIENNEKQNEAKTNGSEPRKDCIHVRARRGEATDSHSLAERARREKIGERMKLLQDLVPGCNKVSGKAVMLDEIINYVQLLQRQVEFLSMKLASVVPLDFATKSLLSKDKQEIHQMNTNFFNEPVTHSPSQLPFIDVYGQSLAQDQFSESYEDDLQSFVQVGFGQNSSSKQWFHLQNCPGSSDTT